MKRFSNWIADCPDWQWNLFTLFACAVELALLASAARLGFL